MIESELVKSISSNFIRAQADERCGDSHCELQHLLWAVQDISKLLLLWQWGGADSIPVRAYAASACYATMRMKELIGSHSRKHLQGDD